MRPLPLLTPLLALLLLGTAPAQTKKVLPLANTGTEGADSSPYPFGYTNPKTQQVWLGSAITKGVALINGFHFRRDTSLYNRNAIPGRTYTNATISLGHTSVAPATMSSTFANNVTSALTQVLSAGTLSLPAQPAVTTFPAKFDIGLTWTTPYIFDPNRGDLLMQIDLPGAVGKSAYHVDATQVLGGPSGLAQAYGQAGTFTNPATARMSADATKLTAGGTVDIRYGMFRQGYAGSLALGVSDKTWGGVILPFDLGVIGATGNHLYTSLDLQVPFNTQVVSGNNHQSQFIAPIPGGPAFVGVTFYAQAWYLDANANAAGLVTTEGMALTTANPAVAPMMNLVGFYDAASPTGNFLFGTQAYGGPIVEFFGVFP